jgi:uncharacterized membrane protein YfbV (UPF0208 family)
MNPNVLTAAISASAAVITAVVALVLNSRGFAMLGARIGDTNRRIDDTNRRIDDTNRRIDDTNHRLGNIEGDLKEFFKVQAEHDRRLGRIEDKLGIPPH